MKFQILTPLLLTSFSTAQNFLPEESKQHLTDIDESTEPTTPRTFSDQLGRTIHGATFNHLCVLSQNGLPSKIVHALKQKETATVLSWIDDILKNSISNEDKLTALLGKESNGETLFRNLVNHKDLDTVNTILHRVIQSKTFNDDQIKFILEEVKPNYFTIRNRFSHKIESANVYSPEENKEKIKELFLLTAGILGFALSHHQLFFNPVDDEIPGV